MSKETKTSYSTPTTETMYKHVSIRNYTGEPIPDEMLREILNAARRGAPTSSNLQAYTIIVVRDPDIKKELAVLGANQDYIENCAAYLLICADTHRIEQACIKHGEKLARNFENFLVSTVDAALVGMTIATAAESFGLGTVMIGAMRNHPSEVNDLLNIPEGVYVVFGMCVGWPDESQRPTQKPRLPEDLVIHHDKYNHNDPNALFDEYDRELAAHYKSIGRNLRDEAWTGVIAERFSKFRREHLRKTIDLMGFVLD